MMVRAVRVVSTLALSSTLTSAFVHRPVPSLAPATTHRISHCRMTSTTSSPPTEDEKPTGHSVPGIAEEKIDPNLQRIQERLMEHQKGAAKLSPAEEARTLVYYASGLGVLGTNGQGGFAGYPASAMVGFAVDYEGRPIFSFSSISTHKRDLIADPKASFTVAHKDFKGLDDGRVSFVGEICKVPDEEASKAREIYLAKHPGHFWVDFGDFDFFRMDKIVAVRYNGGFARFGAMQPEEYLGAQPDPVNSYAAPVMTHMNGDHGDATIAMVKHYVGIEVSKASIVALDRLGMYVKIDSDYGSSKIRLPFPRPVSDRKDMKQVLVEMTNASMAST